MRTFYPPPDSIARGAYSLRARILKGYYTLSSHADERMAQRGITLKEVIDCIRNGSVAGANSREIIDGYLCVVFYYGTSGDELVVPVRATFGDLDAKPIIVTAYRNSADDYVPGGEIDDIVEHVVVEKFVIKAPDDMTDDELEAALARRQEANRTRASQEADARMQKLAKRKAELLRDRKAIEEQLAQVEADVIRESETTH